MTRTDEDIFRAARAVHRFSGLCGGLTTVARACTGEPKLQVRPGESSCTDGKTIWIRPAIELGDNLTHERRLCGRRDPSTKIMFCNACSRDDFVLAIAYHEIAHIAFESFSSAGDDRIEAWRKLASDRGFSKGQIYDRESVAGHLGVASLVDPQLPWAFNALEDVRVNNLMREERPGFVNMMKAKTSDILDRGIDTPDGKLAWSDQPPHAQAGIAAYSMADETDEAWRAALDEDAVAIVYDDDEIQKIAADVAEADNTFDSMGLSYKLVNRFRELGVLPPLPPPEEDEGGGGEGDDEDGEAGDGGAGDGTPGGTGSGKATAPKPPDGQDETDPDGGTGAGGDDVTDAPDAAEGESGSADDGPSEDEIADEVEKAMGGASGHPEGVPDETDFVPPSAGAGGGGHSSASDEDYLNEIFKIAIQQMRDFDAPSNNVDSVHMRDVDDSISAGTYSHFYTSTQARQSEMNGTTQIIPGIVGPGVSRLRRIFDKNKAASFDRNRKRGRVAKRGLARKIVAKDDRIFQKKTEATERDYFVVIMLDMSGSTRTDTLSRGQAWERVRGSGRTLTSKDTFRYPNGEVMMVFDAMKHLASHLGDMLDRLNVDFAVYGHTAGLDYTATAGGSMISFDVAEIKGPGAPWGTPARHRLNALQGASGNLDGHAMEFCRKAMQESSATDKIVMYMSDGEMPAENYSEEEPILRRECKLIKAAPDMHAVGLGIHCDSPKEYGLDTVVVNEAADIAAVIRKLEGLMA